MMGRILLAASMLTALPLAAVAQDADPFAQALAERSKTKPLDEVFADLALGHCPMVLAGQYALENNPALTGMGFPAKPSSLPLGSGPIPMVAVSRDGGTVSFAGAPGRICRVAIEGGRQDAAQARLKQSMASMAGMGITYKPAADLATPVPGAKVEGFKAVAGGQTLNLQLFQMTAPKPALIAQLYVTE